MVSEERDGVGPLVTKTSPGRNLNRDLGYIGQVLRDLPPGILLKVAVLGILGGLALGLIIFGVLAFFVIKWPFTFLVSNLIVDFIMAAVLAVIAGYFWKRETPELRMILEPVYAGIILVVAAFYVVVMVLFYL